MSPGYLYFLHSLCKNILHMFLHSKNIFTICTQNTASTFSISVQSRLHLFLCSIALFCVVVIAMFYSACLLLDTGVFTRPAVINSAEMNSLVHQSFTFSPVYLWDGFLEERSIWVRGQVRV